jgi:hypothetical protein
MTTTPDLSGEPWADRIMGQIEANATGGAPSKRRIAFLTRRESFGQVIEAARRRDLSLTAYVFRCVWAFVVTDLGLDWFEEMEHEPRARRLGQRGFVAGERSIDIKDTRKKGRGHGNWKIDGLSNYGD